MSVTVNVFLIHRAMQVIIFLVMFMCENFLVANRSLVCNVNCVLNDFFSIKQ